jgi:hypothetical protein
LRAKVLCLPAQSRFGEGRARKRCNLIEKGVVALFHSQWQFPEAGFGTNIKLADLDRLC